MTADDMEKNDSRRENGLRRLSGATASSGKVLSASFAGYLGVFALALILIRHLLIIGPLQGLFTAAIPFLLAFYLLVVVVALFALRSLRKHSGRRGWGRAVFAFLFGCVGVLLELYWAYAVLVLKVFD